jgi:hypothetical protein
MNRIYAPHDASIGRYERLAAHEATIARQPAARQPLARFLLSYDGASGFLTSLSMQLSRWGRLSDKQWAAAGRIHAEQAGREPAGRRERAGSEPAPVGVYRQDGRLFVVREFTPQGEDRKVRYAREIIPLTAAQGDRLSQDGERVRIEERKAPGMQYRLAAADALPMAEVTALSVQWEHCLVCGRHLRVAESVERGIGPVCYGRQTALIGAA